MIFDQDGGGRVFIDPLWVTGVREVEKVGRAGPQHPQLLALISTRGAGEPYVVRDPERTAIDLIGEAKTAAGNIGERVAAALEAVGLMAHGTV